MKTFNKNQFFKLFALLFFACAVVSCSNSTKLNKEQFLKDFYAQCVFGYSDATEQILEENASQRLLKFLSDAYEYDCEEDNCYEMSCFRTGFQDSDSRSVDKSEIVEIIDLENNSYRVRYLDMGWKGSTCIKFVEENGKWVMDELVDERGIDEFTYVDGEYIVGEN